MVPERTGVMFAGDSVPLNSKLYSTALIVDRMESALSNTLCRAAVYPSGGLGIMSRTTASNTNTLKLLVPAVYILLVFAVCTVPLACGGEDPGPDSAADLFAEAGEAYENGQLANCRDLLMRVAAMDPNNPNVWRNLGTVNLDMGLYDDAVSAYWMVLEIDSTMVDVLTDVTAALVGAGRIEEALHTGELSIQVSPEDGLAFNNYGMALLSSGRINDAAVCFNTALRREPENSSVLYNCGRMELLAGNAENALLFFQEASNISPDYLQPQIELARTLGILGRHQEAEEQILAVLAVVPSDTDALNILAITYSSQGRQEEAIDVLESILENNPEDLMCRLGLAECYYKYGDMPEALVNYRVFMDSLEDTTGTSDIQAKIRELEVLCDQPGGE